MAGLPLPGPFATVLICLAFDGPGIGVGVPLGDAGEVTLGFVFCFAADDLGSSVLFLLTPF